MQIPGVAVSYPSFTSEINHLREENTILGEAVSRRQEEAAAEATVRPQTHEKLDQLEGDLRASRGLADRLTKEKMHLASEVRRQTERFGRCEEIKRALLALHRLAPTKDLPHEQLWSFLDVFAEELRLCVVMLLDEILHCCQYWRFRHWPTLAMHSSHNLRIVQVNHGLPTGNESTSRCDRRYC